MLELIERFASALSFFYWGLMKVLHYPLTQHRLSLTLAMPPFLVSLIFVILAVEEASGRPDMYITHLLRFTLIVLALMFGMTEQHRLMRRLRIKAYVDQYFTDDLDLGRFGLGRDELVSLFETLGWQTERSGPAKDSAVDRGAELHRRDVGGGEVSGEPEVNGE